MGGITVATLIQWFSGYAPQIIEGGEAAIARISQALTDSGIEHDRAQLLTNIQEAAAREARNRHIADGTIQP
jgi:hypothetical protein